MIDICILLFQLSLIIIVYYIFYLVIKRAVKNGILEAHKAMENKKVDKEKNSETIEQ